MAVVLLLTALYVSLGRALLPLVAEYRGELEQRASLALGQPLHLGALEGRWQGLAPQLVLRDLQLSQEGEALYVDQLRLVPDLWASLRTRSLRIARLELDGLQLGVQEQADGRWRVKGLRPADPAAPPLDPVKLFSLLLAPGEVRLQDSRLSIERHTGELLVFNYLGMSLENTASAQRLDGRLTLPDGQPLSWQLRSRLSPQDWRAASAQLYLSLPQSDWAPWLAGRLPGDWQLPSLKVGGELWLDWAAGQVQRGAARLHAPQLALASPGRAAAEFTDLALSGHFQREAAGWRLLVDELAGNLGGERFNPGQLQLTRKAGDTDLWLVQAERLNLAPLAVLSGQLAPLPDSAAEILATLAPHGWLRDLNAEIRPRETGLPQVDYRLRLENVGVSAWHGVPVLENVSGSLSGDLAGGELRLDTEDFLLHLSTLFPEPWRYRRAQARLNWSLDAEAFTLSSELMRLSGDEGELAGNMLIRLRHDPAAEDYMDLQVGMRQGDARFTERYLPTRSPGLSPQLAGWLKSAIRQGSIDQGMFVYQGSLNRGAAAEARAMALYFQLHDAELAYQPDWPPLQQLAGEVFVEDSGVRVNAPTARVLDSRLSEVRAQVLLGKGGGPRLTVDGQVQGVLSDGLKILQDTPLGTRQTFAGWQGEGPLDGRLQLQIPLAHQSGGVHALVDFATEGARLRIPRPALELQQLAGRFRYDTDRGLSAEQIRAQAFERPLQGNIVARGTPGKPSSQLDVQSSIAVDRLVRWLGAQPAQIPASGELPYRLRMDLDFAATSQLRVSSDLRGTQIDLPAPLGKRADEARSANWRMTLGGDERRYQLNYAGLASLALLAPAEHLERGRGELRLGGEAAQVPDELGLHIRGRLEELDWSAWQAVQARYAGAGTGTGGGAGAAGLLQSLQLEVGHFRAGSLNLEQLGIDLRRTERNWRLQLDNPQLAGSAVIPQAGSAPLRIKLQRLVLPARESNTLKAEREAAGVPPSDPLADFDPRSLPAMNVAIDALYLGEERLGRWSFHSRPSATGAHFEQLDLDLKGLHLDGSLDWQGVGTEGRTAYRGRLSGGDLSDVLLAWGYAPSITSEDFRVDVDGNWPGSPAMAGLSRFSGSLSARARQGQVLETEKGVAALRVFGLLNFNSLGRRLRLDFSDLFGRGLAYDRIDGTLSGIDGVLLTRGPLVFDGPSTRLELDGQLDMAQDLIAARLRVTLPLSNNLPLAALLAGAAPVAGALLIVDQLVGDRLSRVASVDYRVDGPWQDPQISLFSRPGR